MPSVVNSYAVTKEDGHLAPYKLERRDLVDNDVLVDILYTGVCHTDIHTAFGDWGKPALPLVPGHELVGIVSKVGPNVKHRKVGDYVGVGCIAESCKKCVQCKEDHEMFCAAGVSATYNSPELRWPDHHTAGGYSEAIVISEDFTVKVPESLHDPKLLRGVAPILCAGITTYSPLRQFNVGKGSKVALVGLGGLGHMFVKLASALGAEVSVIEIAPEKEKYAKELGAQGFVLSSSEESMQAKNGYFDLVLNTIPYEHDPNLYIALVKPYGSLCLVGHIGLFEKQPLNSTGLIFGNKRLSGSMIGGIKETQELLDFCGEHEIIADYTLIQIDEVNDVWVKMRAGEGKPNRFVIDIKSFREANKEKS